MDNNQKCNFKLKGNEVMKKKKGLIIAVVLLAAIAVGAVAGIKAYADTKKNVICEGVYINSLDVGGMTEDEARKALEEYTSGLLEKTVTVNVDENAVKTTVGELGFTCETEATVQEALNYGKTGNFIKRYKEIKDLEQEPKVLSLEVKVENTKIKKFVKKECSAFDIKAKNASLTRKDGKFHITEETTGRKVSVNDTTEKIENYLLNDWDYEAAVIDAVVIVAEPEYTKEELEGCTDLLGSFSTTYASSSASRANNLANAAKFINGTVLYPGDTFSTGKTINPITVENGYSIAAAYENGQVVDSIGGGVCQVSTTLYNAVLKAELEIVERSNHSMIVGYVKPSMDAAIAGDYKDLKFKNNLELPVFIEALTVGRTITFNIYGNETRDTAHRTVEFESKVLQVIQPGAEKITEDPSLPSTYRKVTQSAHVGYKAELWKVVYEDGVEVSRERVNTSSYAAEPAYVTIGTKEEKKDEDKDKDKDKDKDDDKDKDKDKDKDSDKDKEEEPSTPKPTKKPDASEKPSASSEPDEPEPTPELPPEEDETLGE